MHFPLRESVEFKIENQEEFKAKLIFSLKDFKTASLLTGNSQSVFEHKALQPEFDILAGIGKLSEFTYCDKNIFDKLHNYQTTTNDLLLGCMGYDVKNFIEEVDSKNSSEIDFPELYFFQPRFIIVLKSNICEVHFFSADKPGAEELYNYIISTEIFSIKKVPVDIVQQTSKQEYLEKVKTLQYHIHRGDIYEVNYCINFFAEKAKISPESLFYELHTKSPSPFAFYMKFDGKYILSSSPERFIKKKGHKVFSQPMKGTIRRGKDYEEDLILKNKLKSDIKELSENIMIADLVRNDLSRTAKRNTVKADEICGVYDYKQVFQMISTISSEVEENVPFTDIIKTCFPPGSMTGAPKVSAMQLAEKYETFLRGFYSGVAGYILPNGDFDLNVVIRSILYNEASQYLSFSAGSAITSLSVPESEYDECLLKIALIKNLLT